MRTRIAIIGAGLGGLTLAAELASLAEVTIFEKSRGVSGRLATRQVAPFAFDHGTQFITARTPEFRAWLEPQMEQGFLAEWTGPVVTMRMEGRGGRPEIEERPWLEPHYVPTPHMNQIGKLITGPFRVVLNAEVEPLGMRHGGQWQLFDTGCNLLGGFDWVISTAPALQTARLFGGYLSGADAMPPVAMLGCFTLMLGLNRPWEERWIAAKVRGERGEQSPVEWIGVNSSKPGRNAKVTSLVVHSRNEWAQRHIEDDPLAIQAAMLGHLSALTGIDPGKVHYLAMHRWRYALVAEPGVREPYLNPELQLASSGDWCTASRVEEVWWNAKKLAARLKARLD